MIVGILSQRGFIIPHSYIKKALGNNYRIFIEKLSIVRTQRIGYATRKILYKIDNIAGIECMQLPRFVGLLLLDSGIVNRLDIAFSPLRYIQIKLQQELFPNQKIILDYLMNHIYTPENIRFGRASCVLNLRAGLGKTFIAAALIAKLGLRTLYIVLKRPLLIQIIKDLKMCFHDENNIQLVIGGFKKNLGIKAPKYDHNKQDITVIVIDSALRQPLEFFAGYSTIILDEVHGYCSDVRKEIFWKSHASTMFGISATTEVELKKVFEKQLGPVIHADKIQGFTYENVNFNCNVDIINYSGPPSYTQNLKHESTNLIFTHYMHNQYIRDPYRLKLAVSELIKLYDWRGPLDTNHTHLQHSIYIFAEEIEILQIAKIAFIKELNDRKRNDIAMNIEIDDIKEIKMFTGGINDNEIQNITKNGRVLFSTYGYAGTGISIQKMSAIILLTPRKANMIQILARILRLGSDQRLPRIVKDLVDSKTALKYQLVERKKACLYYGFNINTRKVSYTEYSDV